MSTKIEWTGKTWNPVTGCTRASAGCDNCYAVTMTRRLAGMGQDKYKGLVNPGKRHFNGVVRCHADVLDIPLRVKKPTTWFVNSMSDLFHQDVPFEFVAQILRTIDRCPQHTFQVLTKRPARMLEFFRWWDPTGVSSGWSTHRNLWIGVSVEDQTAADERIPLLLQVPAARRFLSCEPLLGPVDLDPFRILAKGVIQPLTRILPIDWVICGGESGHGARPMFASWARQLRDQCARSFVPFFFKQWGAWKALGDEFRGADLDSIKHWRVGKNAAGRLLDGVEHSAMPEPAVLSLQWAAKKAAEREHDAVEPIAMPVT